MSIARTFLIHAKKTTANANWPTEREWAESQPHQWRRACRAFAVASNTRGGVVGKSMAVIVSEANHAGIVISLRTFKHHAAMLQACGIVYLDEQRPFYDEDRGDYAQKGSTWFLHLDRRMPPGVKLTATPQPKPDQETLFLNWCREDQINPGVEWVESMVPLDWEPDRRCAADYPYAFTGDDRNTDDADRMARAM